MRGRRWRWISAAAVVVSLVAGSCSNGGSADSTASLVPSTDELAPSGGASERAEFLKQAASVCDDVEQAHVAFEREIKSRQKTGATVAQLLNGYADFVATERQRLRDLSQPPGDQDELAAIYSHQSEYIDEAHRAAAAAAANDESAYEPLVAQMNETAAALMAALTSYGLPECDGGLATA